jgi:EAL domain-containing protein (putative c-di-GMP-specific phosphodiesterase class I)
MTLLLIDDDKDFTDFFVEAVAELGVTCTALTKSTDILHYDLGNTEHIIIDLSMPGFDGLQILRFLKDVKYDGYISVTSGQTHSVLESAKELCQLHQLNFHTLLRKPFDLSFLNKLIPAQRESKSTPICISAKFPCDQTLVKRLSIAIKQQAIDVYFQPKINLKTREVTGFEALARWFLDGVFVSPEKFISLAEKHQLMPDLTLLIIDKSLKHYLLLNQDKKNNFGLAINLSSTELKQENLPDILFKKLHQYNMPCDKVTLEITETVLLEKKPTSLEVLTRLRLMGFKLSIDDFGSGYSSVNMLQNGPFTELKIDRAFIKSINIKKQSKIIVKSIVDMATQLGLSVVSEGIETPEEARQLFEMNCHTGQGYFFSKPMPASTVNEWLSYWRDEMPTQ